MEHEKQYKQTSKNILIFPHHHFPFFFVYFELKKSFSFSLNLKSEKKENERKTCLCFDPLHVVDVAAVSQNKTQKKSDTNVVFYFNIIILIAYVALVNKRISQFIGWHVCLWHLSTISHSNTFLIYHFISRKGLWL